MTVDRRQFLQSSAATAAVGAAASLTLSQARAAAGASRQVVLAVMGTNGRGTALARAFAGLGDVTVATVCDVDKNVAAKCAGAVEEVCGRAPQQTDDVRRVFDDPAIDGIVCAAPNHWHSIAGLMASAAGKHAYIEKPISHNPRESELLIAASKKHQTVIQHGTQRRSYPGLMEAVQRLREGVIGEVLFARGWYNNQRPTIGNGKPADVPAHLNYTLWQGPAPERAYQDNLIHYNWHWFWDYGSGELGNNGIHALDVCRWGLDVSRPVKVSSGGGKYRYPDDDQQTPDTHVVTYDFANGTSITWEGRSWHRRGFEDSMFGMAFYGTQGSLVNTGGGDCFIYDMRGKLLDTIKGSASQTPHFQNFIDAIRGEATAHADAQIAHDSVMLCHYGNMAHRTGQTLHIDPETGHPTDAPAAMALWQREYRDGWEPKV